MFVRHHHAIAAACLLLASPALAQPEQISITVSTADLDLATDKGRARLDRRIRHAADDICDDRAGGLAARTAYRACLEPTLAAASQDVTRLVARNTGDIKLARNAR